MSLDLHHIKNSESSCSYFLKRPFGNYIIFSDGLSPLHVNFFQSKGGVYKQFIEDPTLVNRNQKDLFIKFGAAGVASGSLEKAVETIPFEDWGAGFSDPTMRFRNVDGLQSVILKQGDQKISILGKSYFYKNSKDIIVNGEDRTEEIFSGLEAEGVGVVLFCSYSWDHMVEL